MRLSQPVISLIKQRRSIRTYRAEPIEENKRRILANFLANLPAGPFHAPARFELVYATSQDRRELQGLGTYGFIRDAPGFVIGTTSPADYNMEDFGFRMEQFVLFATDLGLGTCWLGGFFTRSSFARKISVFADEVIPAVCAVGQAAERPRDFLSILRHNTADPNRLNWNRMFFDSAFNVPMTPQKAGPFADVLEMVRLGPSASNQQPWRVVRQDNRWHFYLRRTLGKRTGLLPFLLGDVDIQRVDMGIAMCHFELAAAEAGLGGKWMVCDPGLPHPGLQIEYLVSWVNE